MTTPNPQGEKMRTLDARIEDLHSRIELPEGKDLDWIGSSDGWVWLGYDGKSLLGSIDGTSWIKSLPYENHKETT